MSEIDSTTRELLDAMEAEICLLDRDGAVLAVNRAWTEFSRRNGFSPARSFGGLRLFSASDGAVRAEPIAGEAVAGIRAVIVGEEPHFSLEYPFDAPAGRRWFGVRVSGVLGDGPVRAVVFHYEITARKLAREKLVESEGRFRSLVESVPNIAVQGYDETRRVVFWNTASEALYGYRREEALGQQLEDLIIPPEMRDGVKAAVEDWANGGRPIPAGELVLRRKDGRAVSVFSSHVMLVNSRGEKEMHCLDVDLTELKTSQEAVRKERESLRKAARELRQRESELAAARRLAQVGSWEWSLSSGAAVWSDDVYGIFGLDPALPPPPAAKQPFLFAPSCRERFEAAVRAAASEGTPFELDLEALRPDGTTRSVTMRGEPQGKREGRVTLLGGTVLDVTERKLTEALRQSEENFRGLFDSIDHLLFVLDEAGNVLRINKAVTSRLGFAEDELVGRSVLLLHPEERREEAARIVAEMLAGGTNACPVPVAARNGDLIPVETRVVRGTWDGRSVLFGITKDLTELRASEEKFARTFQSNPSPMALSSMEDHRFVDVNEAFLKTLGYSRDEVLGKTSIELGLFAKPEQREAVSRLLAEHGSARDCEVDVQTRSGVRHGIFAADILQLQDRQLLLTVMIDVTEKRLAEEELARYRTHLEELVRARTAQLVETNRILEREVTERLRSQTVLAAREEQYRLLFEANPMPMWVVDLESLAFLEVNDAAMQHYGYSREEFLARTLRDIRPPEDLPVFDLALNRTETGIRHPGIFRHVKKDGSIIDAEITTHEITFGGRRGRIVLAKDVTERHRAATEIHRLNVELEERVRQRTAQLVVANRELEAFAYSVSHDLRAPLRAINGFSHLLEEHVRGGLDEEGHRLIDNIRRGERRMESLISALLELSRASRGKLSVVPIDVNDLVREVLAEVIPQDEGAKVDVRLSDLPPASGDLGLVRQVFRNLLGNAVKFSSHREHPVVEVGGTVRDGLREYFVKDNGVGFDPSHAGKLFRTFERLHTDREFEGTGIGLSIVHRIVERHGGRAWAEGRVDGGATFWFTLGAVASES